MLRPEREEQALREAGRTDVSRTVSGMLVALFLATVVLVPLLEPILSDSSDLVEVALGVPPTVRAARQDGLLAANRALLAGMKRFEDSMEEESFLRDWVLPGTQHMLGTLGVGNEQAYLGREGWLFLRADFDHVTGPGFLEARVLRSAHLEGSRAADPLPAILALDRDLAARGVELIVMPTPVKPTVHPEFLRADGDGPIHNPSFSDFVDRLESAGIQVFDPSIVLAAEKARGQGPVYLRTDTHWNASTVELTARELADVLENLVDQSRASTQQFVRRHASVAGQGDIARLLRHSDAQEAWTSEKTEVSRVLTRQGRPWKPDRDSEVLLLGDSFTNVYSEAALGWGTGAGLAEQLSFELGRPVDRIAINAGGSWSSRQALARAAGTSSGMDRLAGKRVVVYQFATRELSNGDWKLLDIPAVPGSN